MNRTSSLAIVLIFSLLSLCVPVSAQTSTTRTPVEVAGAYFDAVSSRDLERAGELFASTSSIFESGGKEGSWSHYFEHHLGPEIEAIESFTLERGEAEVSKSPDGAMAFVAWPIEYRIELAAGRVVNSVGTVTFVLVAERGDYRIRHLHWSSRPKRE